MKDGSEGPNAGKHLDMLIQDINRPHFRHLRVATKLRDFLEEYKQKWYLRMGIEEPAQLSPSETTQALSLRL